MEYVTTVSFSIFANGEKRASFKPSRGLWQGDPLSPYLFILVVDVLSRLINQSLLSNQITGIKIRRSCPTLSHLLFADDVLRFLKANLNQCHNVRHVLRVYCEASCQQINFDKSGIQFSASVSVGLQGQICAILRMPSVRDGGEIFGDSFLLGEIMLRNIHIPSGENDGQTPGMEVEIALACGA